ncbi:MAG: type IV pilus secretin PilQ [Desulfobacterales bacterium]
MEGNIGVVGRNFCRAVRTVILIALLTGCATGVKKQARQEVEKPTSLKLITDISTTDDPVSVNVLIKGKPLLTYSAFKQPSPLSVVLFFPETALENVTIRQPVDNSTVGLIQASELTEEGHTTKILISLKKDVPYVVNREDDGLRVSFQKAPIVSSDIPEKEAKTKAPVVLTEKKTDTENIPDVLVLQSVETAPFEKGIEIKIMADGHIQNYKSFTIATPPRIVLDMFDVRSRHKKEQIVPVDTKWVRNIRYYGYPEKVRLVIDTQQPYLSAFKVNAVEKGLTVDVGEDATVVSEHEKKQARELQSKVEEPAWVNRVDFLSEEAGKSTVIIGTTLPVKYDIKKSDPKRLTLTLFNTKLPDYRRRPLITTRFESAVDRITPAQPPGGEEMSMITLELREPVPYMVEQSENLIKVHFEASSIPPRPLTTAKLQPWEAAVSQEAAGTETETGKKTGVKTVLAKPGGKYTGEKIALNFYETDIKNVLRIIREISGKNIAIDKDVTGKVTLAFDKPVPWDQVLDLILKMNNLGQVYEGDIIRIARLDTISKEKKRIRDKVKEEPLHTEYILINYADAQKDVLPLLKKIKTERGSLSVDTRTNQIIMTDVQSRIDRAREIVKNIDKVTPQVIIEAKIVEANTNFSRSIGIDWSMKGGPIFKNFFKGVFSYDVGFSYPIADASSAGFKFTKILGTPFDLDMKIMAAETNKDARLLSAPKIKTADNEKAIISQGIKQPYPERDESGLTTVAFIDILLELEVTPHITADNRVSMLINIKKEDSLGNVNIGGSQVPVVSTNKANTTLLVNDADTIVIGGILKTKRDLTESGFPVLSKIPILGWLFKSKIKSKDDTELIIFITPRVVQLEQRTAQK